MLAVCQAPTLVTLTTPAGMRYCDYPYFTYKETEAQSSQVTCSGSPARRSKTQVPVQEFVPTIPSASCLPFRTKPSCLLPPEASCLLVWVRSLLWASMAPCIQQHPSPIPRSTYHTVKFACQSPAGLETLDKRESLPGSPLCPPSTRHPPGAVGTFPKWLHGSYSGTFLPWLPFEITRAVY